MKKSNNKFNNCVFFALNEMAIIINIISLRLRGLLGVIILGC